MKNQTQTTQLHTIHQMQSKQSSIKIRLTSGTMNKAMIIRHEKNA